MLKIEKFKSINKFVTKLEPKEYFDDRNFKHSGIEQNSSFDWQIFTRNYVNKLKRLCAEVKENRYLWYQTVGRNVGNEHF